MNRKEFEKHQREIMIKIGRTLVDSGLPVEAGFQMFRKMFVQEGVPEDQLKDLKVCFFAGAEYLFGTLMSIMSPGDEVGEADLSRMDSINNELEPFREFLQTAYDINMQKEKGKPN